MADPKIASSLWNILLILIFLRPFISEYTFFLQGGWYILTLIVFSIIYLAFIGKKILLPLRSNIWPTLFLLAILSSLLFAGCTIWSLVELYFFIPNILIFYIASKIKPHQQKQLINAIFVAAYIICIYALYQYFIGYQHMLDYLRKLGQDRYAQELLSKRRAFATFISPNIFASYAAMMSFVSLGILGSSEKRERLVYGLAVAIMALSLLYTKSFGGLLSFILSFALFLYFSLYLGPKKLNLKWLSLVSIFLLSIFIFAYIYLARQRLSPFFDLNNPNNSLVQRFYYWKTSINMFKAFPLTGIGWGNFGALYRWYKPFSANISHYSHNVFLQILVETGPWGLVSFLAIVVIYLLNGLYVIRNSAEKRLLKIGLFCAGCAFLIHNLLDLTFYFGQVAFFWWLILGLFCNFRKEMC